MREYEGFIGRIREYQARVDYDQMLSRIEACVSRRKAGARLALVGALTLFLMGFIAYFALLSPQPNGNLLMSYVYEREGIDGPLLEYVFYDNGTF
jgi:hypothetical protein